MLTARGAEISKEPTRTKIVLFPGHAPVNSISYWTAVSQPSSSQAQICRKEGSHTFSSDVRTNINHPDCHMSNQPVGTEQRKSYDPFVPEPAFPMDNTPWPLCFSLKFSSSNLITGRLSACSVSPGKISALTHEAWKNTVIAALLEM